METKKILKKQDKLRRKLLEKKKKLESKNEKQTKVEVENEEVEIEEVEDVVQGEVRARTRSMSKDQTLEISSVAKPTASKDEEVKDEKNESNLAIKF